MLVLAAAWVAGAFFAALFVTNLAQIVMRQFTGGWTWVGDLNTILFSWMVMLGAAAAYGRNEHIATSFLVERVPDALARPTAYLVRTIELLLGFILIVAGLSVAETRMDLPYVQLGVPTGWTYLAIPVFGALIVFFGLVTRPRTPTVLEQVQPVEPTTRGESLA
ncbi:TRAP transporter small permease [Nesterenkonia sp. Act20]|uniref:TRAP transporter small permease n=1 Tax=Nesterenkonia sp. Act20 TaxID=1483432 RepID=UPI001C46A584